MAIITTQSTICAALIASSKRLFIWSSTDKRERAGRYPGSNWRRRYLGYEPAFHGLEASRFLGYRQSPLHPLRVCFPRRRSPANHTASPALAQLKIRNNRSG
jgi:hypothetical protein